jgi:APA family basic amino acid/polyamine antiporter
MMTNTNKPIGFWIATALVVGNMIGSGIFLLPASLGAYGGISLFGWLFSAGGALLIAFTFARLSRILPKAGGPYAFTKHGFGDFPGFLIAWGYWMSIWTGNAAISIAMVGYLAFFWPAVAQTPFLAAATALLAIWILSLVNISGIRNVGKLQLITTILKLAPLIIIALLGVFFIDLDNFTPWNLSQESNFSAITSTAALTLWAFLGLESATIPANHIVNAEKTIPRATIAGTLIAAGVYILGTIAVMGVLPAGNLSASTAPFADAARFIFGDWAGYFVAAGAVIACFGALNGWILMQGQIPLAAADDHLFPKRFGKCTRKGIPVFGIVISSILATILMVMNYTRGLVGMFTFAILLATLFTLLPYLFSSMTAVLMSFEKKENIKFVHSSAIVAGLAFIYSIWAVAGAGQETVYWGFLFLLSSLPVYVLMKRQNANTDSETER